MRWILRDLILIVIPIGLTNETISKVYRSHSIDNLAINLVGNIILSVTFFCPKRITEYRLYLSVIRTS